MQQATELAAAISAPFELAPLNKWLARHLAGFSEVREITKFAGGQSNPTYKLVTREGDYVMRTKPAPAAQLLPSAHAIEREYRVMTALASTDVPVPRTHCLCEDESVIGRAFYVMDCVDGRVLWDQSLPNMAPSERGAIYEEMNRVIAALHAVDAGSIGLDGFGRPQGYFQRQIARWTKQYQSTETDSVSAMDRLIEWLPLHMPQGDESTIVHGDFRMDNLIFAKDEPRVMAILDWELSTLGHPLADFSYHCLSWHLPPGPFRGIEGLDHRALGIPSERDHIRRYCERTGRELDAVLEHWNFYLAFNLFRLAGIAQGVAKRALDGIASNARALETRQLVEPLARAGLAAALRAG